MLAFGRLVLNAALQIGVQEKTEPQAPQFYHAWRVKMKYDMLATTAGFLLLIVLGAYVVQFNPAGSASEPRPAYQRDFAPDISPDGKTVLFYSYRTEKKPDLHALNLETGAETQITDTPNIWEIEPSWLPDGKGLIYPAGQSMKSLKINRKIDINTPPETLRSAYTVRSSFALIANSDMLVTFRKDSNFLVEIKHDGTVRDIEVTLPQGQNSSPHPSPNGAFIAFLNEQNNQTDIFVINIKSGETWQLTDTRAHEEYLNWSRDSRQILYAAKSPKDSGRIYGVNVDTAARSTTKPIQLSHGPEDQTHIFSSGSADGQWLYYDASVGSNFYIFRQSLLDLELAPEQLTGLH